MKVNKRGLYKSIVQKWKAFLDTIMVQGGLFIMQIFFNYPMYPQYQPRGLSGKMVNTFDEITVNDIPMDGSVAVFVNRDLGEIQTRAWRSDGTISKTTFKPEITVSNNLPINCSTNATEKGFEANMTLTEAFKKEITDKLDRLEELITKNTPRTDNESGKNEYYKSSGNIEMVIDLHNKNKAMMI